MKQKLIFVMALGCFSTPAFSQGKLKGFLKNAVGIEEEQQQQQEREPTADEIREAVWREAYGGEEELENARNKHKQMTIIGEELIGSAVMEDPYGVSGIYYTMNTEYNILYVAKIEVKVSETKSTAKGAGEFPEYLEFKYDIPYKENASDKGTHTLGYAYAQSLVEKGELFYSSDYNIPPIFQLAPGVLLKVPSNTSSHFGGTLAPVNKPDYDWAYLAKSGTFYVKDKEEAANWGNNPETTEIIKTKVMEHYQSVQGIYQKAEAKKNANTEMPAMGKLNTKFIQDRALKTYNEKYNSINKGWTHHYMYVHGNEWVNKKARNKFGELADTHRELQVVIVRTSPSGECRADLMYYVELYQDGKYNAAEGKVTGPVSYIGMPGGILPCEKSEAFKSKLAK